ncbi:hypothetical protein ACPVPU_06790 [Sphingomonas sp. CJ99]
MKRRQFVTMMAGAPALCWAGALVAQDRDDPLKPKSPAPTRPARTSIRFDAPNPTKFDGRVLHGQLLERLVLQTQGLAGQRGQLVIGFYGQNNRESSAWASAPFRLTDGEVSLFRSGCTLSPAVFSGDATMHVPGTLHRDNWVTGRATINEVRQFMESRATAHFLQEGIAMMLVPLLPGVRCNLALFDGYQDEANGDPSGRHKWSLPAL